MRLDLTPYRRSTIGFDRLFDMLESNARAATAENYPPFNLERLAEDRYRITLAVEIKDRSVSHLINYSRR